MARFMPFPPVKPRRTVCLHLQFDGSRMRCAASSDASLARGSRSFVYGKARAAMPCNKRPFNSPEEARAQLRVWQRRSRRSALDTVHVYSCKDDHKGKFHVGHSPDRIKRSRGMRAADKRREYDATRSQIFGSLDDLFTAQEERIRTALNPRSRETRNTGGPLIMPETGTLSLIGDDINVDHK